MNLPAWMRIGEKGELASLGVWGLLLLLLLALALAIYGSVTGNGQGQLSF